MEKFFSLIRFLGSRLFFPVFWTITIIVLLCIPGKSLPGMGLFGFKHFDKIIHVFLFGGFVLLWGIYCWSGVHSRPKWQLILAAIFLISLAIGVIMEYVQAAYIPQRSFDVWDIWSDLIGSLLFGYILWKWGSRWKLLI